MAWLQPPTVKAASCMLHVLLLLAQLLPPTPALTKHSAQANRAGAVLPPLHQYLVPAGDECRTDVTKAHQCHWTGCACQQAAAVQCTQLPVGAHTPGLQVYACPAAELLPLLLCHLLGLEAHRNGCLAHISSTTAQKQAMSRHRWQWQQQQGR